ncbi:MAG: acyl-CoA dehydrogenase family protein [Alphaproteobacteria bacterium]
MHLTMSPEDQAFRDEVRAFLDTELTPEMREATNLTSGVFSDIEIGRRWHKTLYDKGWVAPGWPVEYGGTGWSVMQKYIYNTESARAGAPRLFAMGLRMCGPVVMKFGRQDQKDAVLPRILSGEDTWCQGYSEPGSGSDLASLQCRAVSDGDDYVINGTKIWTTGAHYANKMFILVRTSSEGKPQEGISFVLLDMDTPGIKVEPIITIAGDHEVNQVFFDDVRVPKANRVGEENQGWTVAKYLLEFERGGSTAAPGLYEGLERLREIAAAEHADGGRLADDTGFARALDEAEIGITALDFTEQRVMSALSSGENPGAASSMMKTRRAELQQQLSLLGVQAVNYYGAPFQPEARVPGNNIEPAGPDHAVPVMAKYMNFRAATIYAGSNEIQRNIMAKLVLGL